MTKNIAKIVLLVVLAAGSSFMYFFSTKSNDNLEQFSPTRVEYMIKNAKLYGTNTEGNFLYKIVFLLCFLNPIFFGHMIMNSKDTIVVFAHVWSTYIFLKYLQNQKKSKRYVLFAGLTVGLGMGVRFPFLVTLIPLFLFLIIDIL